MLPAAIPSFSLPRNACRLAGAAAAFIVTVYWAASLAAFLESDACFDAGGHFHESTGVCETSEDSGYVPLFSRPALYRFWALFLPAALLPGSVLYVALIRVLTYASRRRVPHHPV